MDDLAALVVESVEGSVHMAERKLTTFELEFYESMADGEPENLSPTQRDIAREIVEKLT